MSALDNVRALQAEVAQLRHERDSWAALAAAADADARELRHDIARHVAIAAAQAKEIEKLRALLSAFAKATDKARHLGRLIHHDRIVFDALLGNEELSVALTATQSAIRISNEALDVFLSGKQK